MPWFTNNPSEEAIAVARALSRILGWTYFILWSISFYPQPIENYRRRSTIGCAVGFPIFNIMGMLSYSISNIAFFWSPVIRSQYEERHNGHLPSVRGNDVAYALHGFLIVVVTYSMFFPALWGFKVDPAQRASSTIRGMLAGSILAVLICVFIVIQNKRAGVQGGWEWIDVIYSLSYVKLILTLAKYFPQAYENFRRQSTVGWSMPQITLDFWGSLFSLAQLVIDSLLDGDWSGVTGNPAKFFLANISLVFDLLFFVQHYILYRGAREDDDKSIEDGGSVKTVRPSHRTGTENEPLLPRRDG